MGFETLLGNQRLKENLKSSVSRGKLSHFYLLSGPAGAGKKTLARLLAAAAVCREEEKPCCTCSACRKVMVSTHPDVITVTDPEHKNVAVKLVRQVREEMFIRPNEADKKVYIFPQELGIEGQNALLKVLEEPPAYGVFLLLTDNPEKILPTVRSRCTELSLLPLSGETLTKAIEEKYPQAEMETVAAVVERSGGYLGQALSLLQEGADSDPATEAFVKAYAEKNALSLLQVLVPMERNKRDQLQPMLERWTEILQQALLCRSGAQVTRPAARQIGAVRSSRELMQAIENLQKATEYLQGNVSPAAVCGFLQWALR